MTNKNINVVILCGGFGTRLSEETVLKPKPMIEIGNMPILWHIMKIYSYYGFNDFVLCLGYKGEIIKQFFLNYKLMNSDITLDIGKNYNIKIHESHLDENWKVILADTGLNSLKGARIKRIEKHIDSELFMLTYGDGVADINLKELVAFHKKHGKIGTLTGVYPPSRFGEMIVEGNSVKNFSEKPQTSGGCINGGFFVFNKKFFSYLSDDENCDFERGPLEKLADEEELMVFFHTGFWECMDTLRDMKYLNKLWNSGKATWKLW